MSIAKFIGRCVKIIYLTTDGRITQRTVYVKSVRNEVVNTFCMTTQSPRTLRIENILALIPVKRSA